MWYDISFSEEGTKAHQSGSSESVRGSEIELQIFLMNHSRDSALICEVHLVILNVLEVSNGMFIF